MIANWFPLNPLHLLPARPLALIRLFLSKRAQLPHLTPEDTVYKRSVAAAMPIRPGMWEFKTPE